MSTQKMQPNFARDGESLKQFHERIIAEYSSEKIEPAVAFLRQHLAAVAVDVREAIRKDPEHWITPYHFGWGMGVRNALRTAGFDEAYWPIWNLDDLYVALVERALAVQS